MNRGNWKICLERGRIVSLAVQHFFLNNSFHFRGGMGAPKRLSQKLLHFAIVFFPTIESNRKMCVDLSIVDLFCGAGGFSLGAAQAGFFPLLGIDIDSDLISAYRLNFPKSRVVETDVSELDRSAWNFILGDVRPLGIIGGPPCQGFSRIGKREQTDARNRLIGSFMDQVLLLKPAFFVMENVEGLLDSVFEVVFAKAIEKVANSYQILGPVRMNAADNGVPTERQRMILIGYDPERLQSLSEKDLTPRQVSAVTVRDAIGDLPRPISAINGSLGWNCYPQIRSHDRSPYAIQMRKPLPKFVGWPVAAEYLERSKVSGCSSTQHTADITRRFANTPPGSVDRISRYPRLSWSGRCPTLRAGTGAERGSFQAARPIHPKQPRVVTVREAARLQGFPDAFVFHSTKWHSFRMIGNSVSPPVAQHVLAAIRSKLK